jgi:Fur family peroxide stress response transcriptional regulator
MSSPKNTFTQLKQNLGAHGVKATSQRLVIYQCLLEASNHPTAEEIFDAIKTQNPSISLGTVYKTLDTLVAAGLAKKVQTVNDVFRFDGKVHNHSHLYCTKTNKIIDFEDEELHELLENYFQKKQLSNFKIQDFQVQITGEWLEKSK